MKDARFVMVDRHGNETEIDLANLPPAKRAAPVVNPLLIGKDEAVARCGITAKQFDALVKEGVFPPRLPGSRVWNRKQLYEWIEVAKMRTFKVEPGWVYFMEMGDFIKIGWSTWPQNRRDALQAANPYDIIILGAFPGGIENEAHLHQVFAPLRTRGEWFRKSPGLLAYIAWLKVAWRGNPKVIAGELDNVVSIRGKTVD